MMQYTDDVVTREGISSETLSNICDSDTMKRTDYIDCSMFVGNTLAFFTNHDLEKGTKSCNLIENENSRNYCIKGLELEIQDSKKQTFTPLTEDVREKFQPQFIKGTSKAIDIRSPALVSDFQSIPEIGMISFNIDKPQYVIMYMPSGYVAPKMSVTVNGQIPSQLDVKNNVLGEDVTMISFVPKQSGLVLITPLAQ